MEEVDEMARRPYSIPISCYHKLNFDGLLARIWDMMVRRQTGRRLAAGTCDVASWRECRWRCRLPAVRKAAWQVPGQHLPCPARCLLLQLLCPPVCLPGRVPAQGLVRVYTKKVGHKPDFGDPVVLRWGAGRWPCPYAAPHG